MATFASRWPGPALAVAVASYEGVGVATVPRNKQSVQPICWWSKKDVSKKKEKEIISTKL